MAVTVFQPPLTEACVPLSPRVTLFPVAGVVYNYTTHGVRRDEAGWEESVSIPLLQPGMYGLMDQWDKYLEDFSSTGAWLPQRYGPLEIPHAGVTPAQRTHKLFGSY